RDSRLYILSFEFSTLAGECGGETGIRTLGTFSRTHAFQACALSRSAISPATGAVQYHPERPAQTLITACRIIGAGLHLATTKPHRRSPRSRIQLQRRQERR